MLLLLLSCAHLNDPERLAERAGLIEPRPRLGSGSADAPETSDGYAPNAHVTETWTVELDGLPPTELLIEVDSYTGEGTWQEQYQAFRRHKPLGPPIVEGSYMDPGYLWVLDMDRDGKDELLLIGDTSGMQDADLSLWSWEGDSWRDRIWGLSPGYTLELADVNQDGVQELIGFGPSEQGVEIEVLCFAQDGLLRPCPTPTPETWLLPLLEALAASPDAPWAESRAQLLVSAAEHYGLRPRDPEALQATLELRVVESTEPWVLAPWLRMMVWVQSPKALPFLIQRAQSAKKLDPQLVGAICALGGQAEAVALVRQEMLSTDPDPIQLGYMSMYMLHANPDSTAWLSRLILDKTLSAAARAELLAWGLPYDPAGGELALKLLTDPELGPGALRALTRATPSYASPRWMVPSERLAPLLTQLPPSYLYGMFEILRHSEGGLEHLEAALQLPLSPELTVALWQVLADMGSSVIDPVQLLSQTQDRKLRRSLHISVVETGDPVQIAAGLALARDAEELGPYAEGLGELVQPLQGPAWEPVDRVALELLRSADSNTRREAIQVLGHLSTPTARAALEAQLLSAPTEFERIDAAQGLATQPGVDPLLIARLETLRGMPDADYERDQVLHALGSMQTPTALRFLADELLRDPEDWQAAFSLATPQGDALYRAYLLSLPTDTPAQCELAASRLAHALRAGLPSAPEELRHLLPRCGAETPKALLGELPSTPTDTLTALEPELRAWSEHPDREVRVLAISALVRL